MNGLIIVLMVSIGLNLVMIIDVVITKAKLSACEYAFNRAMNLLNKIREEMEKCKNDTEAKEVIDKAIL